MTASTVFRDYLQKHDVKTNVADPVFIKLNAIWCSKSRDFLNFDDDKDLDKEMQKYFDSNGAEKDIPKFKRTNLILLWIYLHWRFKTNKEGMNDVPNWSNAGWQVWRDNWTEQDINRKDTLALACKNVARGSSLIMTAENLLNLWNKGRHDFSSMIIWNQDTQFFEFAKALKIECAEASCSCIIDGTDDSNVHINIYD